MIHSFGCYSVLFQYLVLRLIHLKSHIDILSFQSYLLMYIILIDLPPEIRDKIKNNAFTPVPVRFLG